MSAYIGDFAADTTFDHKFCTVTTTGAPTQLAGSPVISVYIDNSTTQITAGVTLSVDFDGVTGLNNVRIVATGANGYTAGSNFQIVITTGTVGGTSVVGYVVGSFSINARSALRPTTAARTLDVSAGGEAGVDWANVGSQSTSVNLSATTVGTAAAVTAISSGGISTASLAAETGMKPVRSNTAQAGSATTITLDASASAVDDFYINDLIYITANTGVGQARFITDYVGATKVATVGTWVTNPDNTSTFAILPCDAGTNTPPTAAQVATAVWQDTTAGDFNVASSIGKSLYTTGASPGAAGGMFIAGSNAATTVSITGNITGNLSGSVASVAGAVASVTGNVGGNVSGNVVGSVASVTGNVGGNVVGSVASVTAAVAITSNVKKNQALASFEFLMTDSSNHAPVTGKTVTCTRSIDAGAFGAGTLASVAEVGNGIYKVNFGAADLNGNVVVLQATASGCDTTFERIVTQP